MLYGARVTLPYIAHPRHFQVELYCCKKYCWRDRSTIYSFCGVMDQFWMGREVLRARFFESHSIIASENTFGNPAACTLAFLYVWESIDYRLFHFSWQACWPVLRTMHIQFTFFVIRSIIEVMRATRLSLAVFCAFCWQCDGCLTYLHVRCGTARAFCAVNFYNPTQM